MHILMNFFLSSMHDFFFWLSFDKMFKFEINQVEVLDILNFQLTNCSHLILWILKINVNIVYWLFWETILFSLFYVMTRVISISIFIYLFTIIIVVIISSIMLFIYLFIHLFIFCDLFIYLFIYYYLCTDFLWYILKFEFHYCRLSQQCTGYQKQQTSSTPTPGPSLTSGLSSLWSLASIHPGWGW